ncbi:MAG: ThuA domain-containing protein [Bacteroidota bacterium]
MSIIKRLLLSLLALLVMAVIGLSLFTFKAVKGFPFYEREPIELPAIIDSVQHSRILLFSKTNAYRHGDAIEGGNMIITQIARKMGHYIFTTESAGIYNPEQLSLFDLVIWNNVSGKVLTREQRAIFQSYLLDGGVLVALHAAGDFSHQWDWYEEECIGAPFSHHPLDPQIQEGRLYKSKSIDSTFDDLASEFILSDEWYVFDNVPDSNFTVLYRLDESGLSMNGNLPILIKDKNYGMGSDHPIVWYRTIGEGKVFYSALGHTAASFQHPEHQRLLESAINWGLKDPDIPLLTSTPIDSTVTQ